LVHGDTGKLPRAAHNFSPDMTPEVAVKIRREQYGNIEEAKVGETIPSGPKSLNS
jgi:hypothetical protein